MWYALRAQPDVDNSMTSSFVFRLLKPGILPICILLTACGSEPENSDDDNGTVVTEPEAPTDPEPTEPAEKTGTEYFRTYCRGCHGTEAAGTPDGPQLRFPKEDYSRWVIRNGRMSAGRRMPEFTEDSLSNTQLDEIMVWLIVFRIP